MTTVKCRQLLQEASESKLDGFCAKTEAFLECIYKDQLGHHEAKLYSSFIQNCLQTLLTKLKGLKEKDGIYSNEICRTSVICAKGYKHLLPQLEEDQKFVVPSLLFHVMQNLHGKTSAENTLAVAEVAYDLLQSGPSFNERSHVIISAFYAHLWNVAGKLLKQGSSLKTSLLYTKFSLLFLCDIPSKLNNIIQFARNVSMVYSQFNKNWIDTGTWTAFYDIFNSVASKLISLRDTRDNESDKYIYSCLAIQIQVILVEHLAKVSDFTKAEEMIEKLRTTDPDSDLLIVLSDWYTLALLLKKDRPKNKDCKWDFEQLENTNKLAQECIRKEKKEELDILSTAILFLTSYFVKEVLNNLPIANLKTLSEICKTMLALFDKCMTNLSETRIEDSDETVGKEKEAKYKGKTDEIVNTVYRLINGYLKHAQLLYKLIEADKENSQSKILELKDGIQNWQKCLEDNISHITEKNINIHRQNIVNLSSHTAYLCMERQMHEEAAAFYTCIVTMGQKTGEQNLMRYYEALVDCYIQLEKWVEGSQVVVQALATIDNGLHPASLMWTTLKKEAAAKDPMFQSVTMNAVVRNSDIKVDRISSRQLLVAEYQAWKSLSRRQFGMEYHVLCELLDVKQTDIQAAEAMVALAINMSITGNTQEDRSASELLNKAIIMMDKSTENCDATLAAANYIKYFILHEEAIDYMKNDSGQIEYLGKKDITETSRFTLNQEQDNLPFLVRAIELWEACLGSDGLCASEGQKSAKRPSKTGSKQSSVVDLNDSLFDLKHHIDCLVLCGSRLIAMKQLHLAIRPLQVAKHQLGNLSDSKQKLDITLALCRCLMLLGKFEEAEAMVDGKGDNNGKTISPQLLLLLSELNVMLGKRAQCLEIVQSVLDSEELAGKTVKVYQINGTAKRLMSMGLCLPTNGPAITSTNQYLLTLAFEAVHCHVTVINFYTKENMLDKNTDKWLILNEILSSLLHLCKLCRFIGLPRDALCYLKAGLNISQGQGLPRWSCEFLFELLGVQSMEADCDKALDTVESINSVLSPDNQPTTKCKTQNQSRAKNNADNQSCNGKLSLEPDVTVKNDRTSLDVDDAFGFKKPLTPKAKSSENNTGDKTPERVYVQEEIDSNKKNKMAKIKFPECVCMKEKTKNCTDTMRHRLCMKAGIVFSDFLAQTDMKKSADHMLTEVQSKFEILNTFMHVSTNEISSTSWGKNGMEDLLLGNLDIMLADNLKNDPSLLYMCLEAGCVRAETFLHQKNFHKVHQMWKVFQSLEQSGCLKNVIHSNILLTRLALCDVSGYMLSLHGDKSETRSSVNQSETGSRMEQSELANDIEATSMKLQDLTVSSKRKVTFEPDSLVVTGTGIRKNRSIDSFTPLKGKPAGTINTPRIKTTTPGANKMSVLEQLMMDSDEENDVVFPAPKPVTPKAASKSAKRSWSTIKSKTDVKNKVKKLPFTIAEDPVDDSHIVCKLNFTLDTSESLVDKGNSNQSKVEKTRRSKSKSGKTNKPLVSSKKTIKKSSLYSLEVSPKRDQDVSSTESKTDSQIDESTCDLFVDQDEVKNQSVSKTEVDILEEKDTNGSLTNEIEAENSIDKFKGGVFDFEVEASPDVKVVSKLVKSKKSNILQRKKTAKKNVCKEKDVDSSINEMPEKKNQKVQRNGSKILKEKETIENSVKNEVLDDQVGKFQGDVFDFEMEASPVTETVSKAMKTKKTKTIQRGKKTIENKSASVETENDEDNIKEESDKENESCTKSKPTTRRGRQKRNVDPIAVENVRCASISDSECKEFDLTFEEVIEETDTSKDSGRDSEEDKSDFKVFALEVETDHLSDIELAEVVVENVEIVNLIEPKEIMRGDTKPNTGKRTTRGKKTVIKNENSASKASDNEKEQTWGKKKTKTAKADAADEDDHDISGIVEESSLVEDEGGACGMTEKMRSGRLAKLHGMTDLIDSLDVVYVEGEEAERGSPCEEDIIPTLESLYERLCQFPPNPQHSDVCHMLALHHLESNPQRAAFLLSDAMAVTFRHQVMLNVGKKARKEARDKGDKGFLLSNSSSTEPSMMFSTDEDKFQDMVNTIPEDWCVVQLSVVSSGLPCKQMILSRFVKHQPPIVLKLPGFSSPQGRHILKDFSVILEKNAETAKIETNVEWWSARHKLNTDMKELVERMEKHWLGVLRCAMFHSGLTENVLTRVQKDLANKVQKDLSITQCELLILAERHLTEKECGQFVCDLAGTDTGHTESILTTLKEYSKMIASDREKCHTVLILDKTIQHLPWESMPILADRSVSRMPCLSHLANQLTSLHAQETSVFVKGVNPRNTYYILNPDSDLPRTQTFFKDWFEKEKGWKGVIGRRPSAEEFVDALTKKDLLIYCGHGSGGRFFNSDEIEKLNARALTVLMGCSSGRLLVKGQLEPSGMMMSYFLAGCPSMVANLWDVTDKDIDKFTEEFLKTWISSDDGTYLPCQVQKARAKCKLRYLNGMAPVVYGLPVFINKQKSSAQK